MTSLDIFEVYIGTDMEGRIRQLFEDTITGT